MSTDARKGDLMADAHRRAGLLEETDLRIARSLLRMGHEDAPELMLATALAVRAPRRGHLCVDLAMGELALVQSEEIDQARALPWPELSEWRKLLLDSSLVRSADDLERRCPLVLRGSRLYTDRYFRYEARLADALTRRACATRSPDLALLRGALDATFTEPEPEGETDRQRLAAAGAMLRRLCVIVGGPGTGKTTTVRKLLKVAFALARASGERAPRVALAAPTGKAASRLRASLLDGEQDDGQLATLPTQTLHGLLKRTRNNETRFRYGAELSLPYDIVVVDEASMIDLAMMAKLVEAISEQSTLILLGDPDQLASVEAGAVLGDLCGVRDGELHLSSSFASSLIELTPEGKAAPDLDEQAARPSARPLAPLQDCVHELTRVRRFRANSGVGQIAALIQREADPSDAVLALLRSAQAPQKEQLSLLDNSVEEMRSGQDDLNREHSALGLTWLEHSSADEGRLRRAVVAGYSPAIELALQAPLRGDNPETDEAQHKAAESEHATKVLDAFDALRVLCAHREGKWGVSGLGRRIQGWLEDAIEGFSPAEDFFAGQPILITRNDPGVGLYNGDVGVCLAHPLDPKRLRVAFWDDKGAVRFVSPSRLPSCQSVFTMSIHKSQGSQFEHVIVVLPAKASAICTRELVYTALTRAQERATIVSSERVLRESLSTQVRRLSGLRELLWSSDAPSSS